MTDNGTAAELHWLLEDLVERVSGMHSAVVLSSDGLLMGRSRNMSKEDAEHLSAMASGLQSLAKGAGRYFDGGGVRQTMVELDDLFLLVTAAGTGACLAVITTAGANMGMVAYEMNLMVKKVGTVLVAAPRQDHASAPRS